MAIAIPDYERDAATIYRRSFAIIAAEADFSGLPPSLTPSARRMIHACGMVDLVKDLAWQGDPAGAAKAAFARGAPLFCDAAMLKAGIIADRFPGLALRCHIGDPETVALAARLKTTRAAAQLEIWRPDLAGAVIAIGNAPTALFRLLEGLQAGWPQPAAIFAFPVGFVGAVESKEALIAAGIGIPFLTLRGRRGGSAIAAAAINALAEAESRGAP